MHPPRKMVATLSLIIAAVLAFGTVGVIAQDSTPTPEPAAGDCITYPEFDNTEGSGNSVRIESLEELWAAVRAYEEAADTGQPFAGSIPETILDQPLEHTIAATIELAAREPGVSAIVLERYRGMITGYLADNPGAAFTLSGRADYWVAKHALIPGQEPLPECDPNAATPTAGTTPPADATPSAEAPTETVAPTQPATETATTEPTATATSPATATMEPTATATATATATSEPAAKVTLMIPIANDADDGGAVTNGSTFQLTTAGSATVRIGDLTNTFKDYGAYFRFENVQLPSADQIASIDAAYIGVAVTATSGAQFNTVISASAAGNPASYSTASAWSADPMYAETVLWPANVGWAANQNVQTAPIEYIVSRIIADPNWQSGQAMLFRITDSETGNQAGRRFEVATREHATLAAPFLYIEYTPTSP
jgi:hypothetical protein